MSRLGVLLPLAASALVSSAAAQSTSMSNLTLHNGPDALHTYRDPSVGAPVGSAPDLDGDFFWRVFPKEVLRHPSDSMMVMGLQFELFDTDWTTTPDVHDMVLAPGMPSATSPGSIEPDFTSPMAMTISWGSSMLADPCQLAGNPFGCAGGCPANGEVLGYRLQIELMEGVMLMADGTMDWTLTSFVPGGMTVFSGGSCGLGDFVIQDTHSTSDLGGHGEVQPDLFGTGISAYGGWNGGPGIGLVPDTLDEVWTGELQFMDPIANATISSAAGIEQGLGALHPSASGALGVRYCACEQVGELAFFVGSFSPLLPGAGLSFGDANVLVDLSDPLAGVLASIWNGPVVLDPLLGPPFDNGAFDAAAISIPPQAIGLTLSLQGISFDASTLDLDASQAISLTIVP